MYGLMSKDRPMIVGTLREELAESEFELVRLVVLGFDNAEIAKKRGTTEQVVKNRLRVIYRFTGTASRLELANRFMHEYPGYVLEKTAEFILGGEALPCTSVHAMNY